jgi:DNA-binding response OmpR family regulator
MIPYADEHTGRRAHRFFLRITARTHGGASIPMGTFEDVISPGTSVDGSRKHILVINDTQEILDLFREILEDEGYRVSLYSSGFNDIHQIVELAPDLVILDLLIGGESQGWQMLQKMKMSRETATIPVVVCTAAVSLARDLEGHLRSKNVGLVLKPFDIDELVDEVRKYLNPASAPMPEVS